MAIFNSYVNLPEGIMRLFMLIYDDICWLVETEWLVDTL